MNILSRWLMKRLSRMAGPYLKSPGLLKANKYNPAILLASLEAGGSSC
jgi:hypothetical protein